MPMIKFMDGDKRVGDMRPRIHKNEQFNCVSLQIYAHFRTMVSIGKHFKTTELCFGLWSRACYEWTFGERWKTNQFILVTRRPLGGMNEPTASIAKTRSRRQRPKLVFLHQSEQITK